MLNIRKTKEATEKTEFLSELNTLLLMLDKNESIFNMITDGDLIEAVIYEKLSLQLRYTYLIKQAKRRGIRLEYTDRLGRGEA
ncbi:MAG: YaaL family protein [Firmicutes bacterium]|nr:YaaL family protein [[Eubacterium] siraeum]MCM1488742.1 YaaL family protein [Bacillota bacterium]